MKLFSIAVGHESLGHCLPSLTVSIILSSLMKQSHLLQALRPKQILESQSSTILVTEHYSVNIADGRRSY